MMHDEKLSITLHSGASLARAGRQNGRIVSEMVDAALSISQAQTALVPRFKIGEHLFCEPDYRQTLLWAKMLQTEPAEVVRRLLAPQNNPPHKFFNFRLFGVLRKHGFSSMPDIASVFKDGRIKQLYWDMELLPLEQFEWVNGLDIESIIFKSSGAKAGTKELSLSLPLPNLRSLFCTSMGLTTLDLSRASRLTTVACDSNRLCSLELSANPHLTSLSCDSNNLNELELLKVPRLRRLSCGQNELANLNLSNMPHLTDLMCEDNKLTELDISCAKELTNLSCRTNQLTSFHISDLTCLKRLDCADNKITRLVLSNTLQLTELSCEYNRLHDLDLSNVPRLKRLSCDNNQLTKLNLSDVSQLQSLSCCANKLHELDLTSLDNYPWYGLVETEHKTPLFQSYDEDKTIPFRLAGHASNTSPFRLSYDEDRTQLILRPDQKF